MRKEHRECNYMASNLKADVKKMNSNVLDEPQLKKLGATAKDTNSSLPQDGAGFGLRRAEGGDVQARLASGMAMGGAAKERQMMPEEKSKGGRLWIKEAIKRPGALHRALKVPEGKKIPEAKMEKAEHSRNPRLRKEAQLAETLKKMHKK